MWIPIPKDMKLFEHISPWFFYGSLALLIIVFCFYLVGAIKDRRKK